MKIEGFLKFYDYCDYIPVAGNITNLITLISKCILFCTKKPTLEKTFRAHIGQKEVLRSLALILLPIISNIFFAIWDYRNIPEVKARRAAAEEHKAKALEAFRDTIRNAELAKKFANFQKGLPVFPIDKIRGDVSKNSPLIRSMDMTAPIMQGLTGDGRPFVAFNIQITIPSSIMTEDDKECPDLVTDPQGNKIDNRVFVLAQPQNTRPNSNDWAASCPGSSLLGRAPFGSGALLFRDNEVTTFFVNLMFNESELPTTHAGCTFALHTPLPPPHKPF